MNKNCIMSNVATATTIQITNTKLYVPVVTLPTKQNLKLMKQISKDFKRSIFWNEYKSKIETQEADNNNVKRILLDSSFQEANRFYVLTYDNTKNGANRVEKNSHQKYFLPRVKLTKYNVLINGLNFYDQPISDERRKYDELRKVCTGNGDDYTTGSLFDYKFFKNHCNIVACSFSRQKELDADPRAIQQIEFNCMLDTNSQVLTVLEKSKETVLEFYKGNLKVL